MSLLERFEAWRERRRQWNIRQAELEGGSQLDQLDGVQGNDEGPRWTNRVA